MLDSNSIDFHHLLQPYMCLSVDISAYCFELVSLKHKEYRSFFVVFWCFLIQSGIILDGKRNDIGATSEAYATAYLGETKLTENVKAHAFGADSLTVNGYLGTDGISPFVNTFENGKTIFVLVKTSNKSSGELQDLELKDGKKIYEKMAELVNEWGKDSVGEYGYSKVGAVVGATYPSQLKEIRESNPNTFFLVPGYGAQGGGAEDIKYAFDKDGLGAIINSSRGIMCAYKKGDYKEEEYAKAARDEAIRMRDEISFIK